jgi:hypothetical protein
MTTLYFWKLAAGDLGDARRIVEELRRKAVELGWEPVGELLHLSDEAVLQDDRLPKRHLLIAAGESVLTPSEVVFFLATPPGDESQAFGLAEYPRFIEGQVEVTPTHLGSWSWVGVVRAQNVRDVQAMMNVAVALGVEATTSFAGMVMTAHRNEQGDVKWDQRPAIDEDF